MKRPHARVWAASTLLALSFALPAWSAESAPTAFGNIRKFDPALDAIVPADWKIEKLADGFTWSEGPVWIGNGGYLLFDDVPANTMYRWSQKDGLSVFRKPSGFEGSDTSIFREPGANGLFADGATTILLADSGNRMVARMNVVTREKTPLATQFEGKRFNSPNDVIRSRSGTLFFTDPPYGLKGIDASKHKELPFNGVYRVDTDGSVHVLDRELRFPNGIALSPDERTLYVSNSDPQRPIWMAYSLNEKGEVQDKRVFADASDLVAQKLQGLPDGMRVTGDGTLFASSPGGILIMDPTGKRLGQIQTGDVIANCVFGDDGHMLYLTSHNFIARIKLKINGYRE
ncbi:MAG TPA: SMP-30/gluconolactonase/LRE family protein [Povalibacter sp.]|jgi:gluconolactonase|nr:SMP-30/gluconolactonase/LRE family protein [Povalibacter sp.]